MSLTNFLHNGEVTMDTLKAFGLEMGLTMETIDNYFTDEFVSN